jgi:hypothetical protein
MKRGLSLVLSAALAAAVPLLPDKVLAASQNECAIWICLPGGFPGGCAAAYSAMINRIDHFQAPLPDFGSCAVGSSGTGDAGMTFQWGVAALVPAHQVCSQYSRLGRDNEYCSSYTTVPAQYVRGTRCVHYSNRDGGNWTPYGCTETYYWVETYQNGQLLGQPYYFQI